MTRRLLSLLVSSTLVAGCTTLSQPPLRSTPTLLHPAITPVLETVTPIPSATATTFPSPTPLPPTTISFYHLRIEYTTTSPWTTLSLETMEGLLTSRLISVDGNPGTAQVVPSPTGELALQLNRADQDMWLDQPWSIGMTVDIALDPQSIDRPLQFQQEKGAWFQSIVRIYLIAGEQPVMIREIIQAVEHAHFTLDLSTLSQYSPSQVQVSRSAPDHMIWAFYYPWYRGAVSGWGGWADPMYTDRPLNHYRTDDPQAIARQIDQARSAGIDGFIVSYSGPESLYAACLPCMLDLAQERGFFITLYLETINPDAQPRAAWDSETISSWLEYALSTYGSHPAFMRVGGKPLIVVYSSAYTPLETWESIFSELSERGLEASYMADGYDLANLQLFDGIHQYGVSPAADYGQLYASLGRLVSYHALLDEDPTSKIWAATVMPGFDNTPLVRWFRDWEHLLIPRDDGDFYRSTLELATNSQADWIIVTSWNEYQENTHIEPSELYGDQYLAITREYAQRWRAHDE
jgi:hypothetical protein